MSKIAQNIDKKPRTIDVLCNETVDFAGLLLSDPVLTGLRESGFERPSPIQLKTIPLGRCGLDLIVQAKSGTGKTCVFSVVALEAVNCDTNALQVLVLAPTREIAVQIWEVIKSLGQAMPQLRCYTFIGGLPVNDDLPKLRKCHIAVGTPGRVKQLIEQGHMDTSSIRLFVLDEADNLLDQSFQESINWIYSCLPENKQMLALSATYPEELAQHLTAYMYNPTFVRLNTSDPALLGVRQYYASLPFHPMPTKVFDIKVKFLMELLSKVTFNQCLIFSNYQMRAETLSDKLNAKGWATTFISGSQDQHLRLTAMAKLKKFHCRVLISTDLTSRGIDAENISLVINIDLPRNHETYLHRVGRAGRFGSYGAAISLVCEGKEMEELSEIENKCNTSIYQLPDPIPEDLASTSGYVDLEKYITTEQIVTGPRNRSKVDPKNDGQLKSGETQENSDVNGACEQQNLLMQNGSENGDVANGFSFGNSTDESCSAKAKGAGSVTNSAVFCSEEEEQKQPGKVHAELEEKEKQPECPPHCSEDKVRSSLTKEKPQSKSQQKKGKMTTKKKPNRSNPKPLSFQDLLSDYQQSKAKPGPQKSDESLTQEVKSTEDEHTKLMTSKHEDEQEKISGEDATRIQFLLQNKVAKHKVYSILEIIEDYNKIDKQPRSHGSKVATVTDKRSDEALPDKENQRVDFRQNVNPSLKKTNTPEIDASLPYAAHSVTNTSDNTKASVSVASAKYTEATVEESKGSTNRLKTSKTDKSAHIVKGSQAIADDQWMTNLATLTDNMSRKKCTISARDKTLGEQYARALCAQSPSSSAEESSTSSDESSSPDQTYQDGDSGQQRHHQNFTKPRQQRSTNYGNHGYNFQQYANREGYENNHDSYPSATNDHYGHRTNHGGHHHDSEFYPNPYPESYDYRDWLSSFQSAAYASQCYNSYMSHMMWAQHHEMQLENLRQQKQLTKLIADQRKFARLWMRQLHSSQ